MGPRRTVLLAAARYLSGGGIDVQENVLHLLPGIAAGSEHMASKDVAYATYVFDMLASFVPEQPIKALYNKLATTYARRFAEWLGYAFLNRANLTRQSKGMKALEDGLSAWVKALPEMLHGPEKTVTSFLAPDAQQFLDATKLEAIGAKVLRVLKTDFQKGTKTADSGNIESLPISYNKHRGVYEIPKSSITYTNRTRLRDLGFSFDGTYWTTPTLESEALKLFPQAAHMHAGPPPPQEPPRDVREWFFHDWLPKNIARFNKVFDDYGRAEGVPYTFQFMVMGQDVEVSFRRNIKTIDEAIREIENRYGGSGDREGWTEALKSYEELMRASGASAMQAVDRANNLEHSHGSMMEHFPPGVRAWYPHFLDFKYTASPWQMINAIEDEDLRVVASELMPLHFRMHRLVPPKTDERTPKGLALEISAQPGKAAKKKLLALTQKTHPDLYPKVVALLEARGLHLT
jgi:hypothetical protein